MTIKMRSSFSAYSMVRERAEIAPIHLPFTRNRCSMMSVATFTK